MDRQTDKLVMIHVINPFTRSTLTIPTQSKEQITPTFDYKEIRREGSLLYSQLFQMPQISLITKTKKYCVAYKRPFQ